MGNQQRSSITSSIAIKDIKNGVIGNVLKVKLIIQITEDQ